MLNLVSVIAAAVFTFSAVPTVPASAAAVPAPIETAVSGDESVDLAYFCEYVIVWDAWGNAYYEYICY